MDIQHIHRAKTAVLQEMEPLTPDEKRHLRETVDGLFIERRLSDLGKRARVAMGAAIVGATLATKGAAGVLIWLAFGGGITVAMGVLAGIVVAGVFAAVGAMRYLTLYRRIVAYRTLRGFVAARIPVIRPDVPLVE
ncbi:MAG: hypothetical protein AAF809_13725 [Bacteroidota bacterium]